MKTSQIYLFITLVFAFTFIGCAKDNEPNTAVDGDAEIEATDFTITGTLKSTEYQLQGGYALVNWKNGKGKLYCSKGVDDNWAEAVVNADGTFTITLPGTILTSRLVQYIPIGGGSIQATPQLFWTNYVHPLFQFVPDDGDLMKAEFVDPKVIGDGTISSPSKRFGFLFAGTNATVIGTSSNGQVTYNSSYKKGWNVETYYDDTNNVSQYAVVNALPDDVVWY